jgi:hypothetical protein
MALRNALRQAMPKAPSTIDPVILDAKPAGQQRAGNPPAPWTRRDWKRSDGEESEAHRQPKETAIRLGDTTGIDVLVIDGLVLESPVQAVAIDPGLVVCYEQ